MSPEDALKYDEFWRKNGIGSNETWDAFKNANPNGTIDDYFKIVQDQSPWPLGYIPEEVLLNPGDKFEMALAVGQDPEFPGRWGTDINTITDVDYVRNDLAVKPNWKPDIDIVAQYQVKEGITIPSLVGPVGPQIDLLSNSYYPGGANQVNLLIDYVENMMDYLDIIGVRPIK